MWNFRYRLAFKGERAYPKIWIAPCSEGRKEPVEKIWIAPCSSGRKEPIQNLDSALLLREEATYPKFG